MISYEIYKTLHFIFILIFFSSLGFAMYENSVLYRTVGKISIKVISVLIFITGMGVLARLNLSPSEAFPLWLKSKVGTWLVINILFMFLVKIKNTHIKILLMSSILVAGAVAIWLAVNKPV